MESELAKPSSKSDSAALGIMAGLGIGLGAAVACVFLLFSIWGIPTHSWFFQALRAIPFLLPPAIVVFIGLNASRQGKNRFAAGLLIAAAVVTLLEGTCATMWR